MPILAYVAFASLAVVILISVIGVMASSVYFWGCFTALHLGFCLFLTLQIYYLGRWRLGNETYEQPAVPVFQLLTF